MYSTSISKYYMKMRWQNVPKMFLKVTVQRLFIQVH